MKSEREFVWDGFWFHFLGLALGSPPNDTIQMSSAAHRTGHWIVHGASLDVCVSDRLASTAPIHLASLLQKANSAAGGTWPLSGPWRQWWPNAAAITIPPNEVVVLHCRERERERERERAAAVVVVVAVVGVVVRVSSSHAPQSTAKGSDILTFRHRASFRYSPENAFYIFNQQIYFIIWYLLDRASLI